MITNEMRAIMLHAAHRAANGHYCGDSAEMQELIKLDLMECLGYKSFVPEPYFRLTAAGKAYLDAYYKWKAQEQADKEWADDPGGDPYSDAYAKRLNDASLYTDNAQLEATP